MSRKNQAKNSRKLILRLFSCDDDAQFEKNDLIAIDIVLF